MLGQRWVLKVRGRSLEHVPPIPDREFCDCHSMLARLDCINLRPRKHFQQVRPREPESAPQAQKGLYASNRRQQLGKLFKHRVLTRLAPGEYKGTESMILIPQKDALAQTQ